MSVRAYECSVEQVDFSSNALVIVMITLRAVLQKSSPSPLCVVWQSTEQVFSQCADIGVVLTQEG